MRQKLGLIQAMMHRPKLLVLDEPTNGLDPLVRQTLFHELKSVVAENRTVLFSSHTLSEVEELCDDVIVLRAGNVIEQEKISVLRTRALRRVEIRFSHDHLTQTELPKEFTLLERSESSIAGTWGGPVPDLVRWLATLDIDDVIVERPGLEDLFMTYYSEPKTSNQASVSSSSHSPTGGAT
jgi:ABC-2 type transport system ATP-binding protein